MALKRTEIQHRGKARQKEPAPPGSGVSAWWRDWFWLVLLVVPPLLIFPRLGEIYLWQDEAETAMIGRAILEHGYPLATVGRNLITDQPGQVDLNSAGVWIYTPWLQGYVTALSFLLFGATTWAARLPFALLGWATLFVQYAALKDITHNRRLSRYAAILLLGSVPFLLHVRQCRYYMLLSLFTALHLWGYVRLTRRAPGGAGLFATAGIGLFYSWFPQAVVSTLAMVVHALWFHRQRDFLRRLALWCAVILAASLPYFLYTRGWSRDYLGTGHAFDSLWRYLATLRAYLLQVHIYCWPGLLALPLLWRRLSGPYATRRRSLRRRVTFFALLWLVAVCVPPSALAFSLMGIALVALGTEIYRYFVMSSDDSYPGVKLREELAILVIFLFVSIALIAGLSPYPFLRYFVGMLPVFAVTTAATVLALAAERKWIALSLTACLLLCDLFQLGPFVLVTGPAQAAGLVSIDSLSNIFGYQPSNIYSLQSLRVEKPLPRLRSLAWDYFQELTHEYVGPIGGVVRYLRAHARPGEVIVTSYEHFPLMFYTDLRVYPDWSSGYAVELPDWVLIHGSGYPDFPERLARALEDPAQYQRVPVAAHEFAFENIPEPNWHRFRTPVDGPPVTLFHRTGTARQK